MGNTELLIYPVIQEIFWTSGSTFSPQCVPEKGYLDIQCWDFLIIALKTNSNPFGRSVWNEFLQRRQTAIQSALFIAHECCLIETSDWIQMLDDCNARCEFLKLCVMIWEAGRCSRNCVSAVGKTCNPPVLHLFTQRRFFTASPLQTHFDSLKNIFISEFLIGVFFVLLPQHWPGVSRSPHPAPVSWW